METVPPLRPSPPPRHRRSKRVDITQAHAQDKNVRVLIGRQRTTALQLFLG
jgi:hypothetical protein